MQGQTNGYGVIWDVDGTLLDSAQMHYEAWVALAKELEKPFTRADFTATFGRRNPEIIRELFGMAYSDQEVADMGFRKEEFYRAAARQGVQLLPGVKTLLEELKAEGYRQAVGSSAPRQNLDLLLDLTDVASFFETVVAMEDTQRGKPDPQVFQVAAERLGLIPARCLVLEDAVAGVQAAKAGGMKCIAVTFVGHHPVASLKEAGANRVVSTLEEVSARTIEQILEG